ncbi:restriction endonuclease subunit S [Aeromonas veronii]|uniref:restriction endonuclease subunit S n=1 Tax=Aeromonas veronii TaxID=654 RepID=UPI00300711E9
MVPNGWSRSQIGEIANVQVGRDLIEDRYSDIESERYKYPVYSNTVENRGLYGFYDFPEYPGNAVTVVGRGIGLGTAFARYENSAFGAIGRLLVLTPKRNSFDVGFLADYINFSLIIHNESGGIPQLPGASLSKYLVTLPPLPEQQKIAKILSTWDKAITTTEQLLANSQQQKKALMQQLLTGKKRLLDNNGVRFSRVWKKGKLSEIANIDSGYAFKSTDFTDSEKGIPIIRMSDFKAGGIDISGAAKVIPEITIGLDRFKLKTGDFVFGMSGSLSNYGWVKEQDLPCFLNQRVGRILAKECAVQLFVTYLYLSDKIQQSILDKAAGAAQLNISSTDLRNTIVNYPSFEEQEKIAAVLSSADQEISALQQKLAALKQEKKALMQQLLTGKRRVKVEEAA